MSDDRIQSVVRDSGDLKNEKPESLVALRNGVASPQELEMWVAKRIASYLEIARSLLPLRTRQAVVAKVSLSPKLSAILMDIATIVGSRTR